MLAVMDNNFNVDRPQAQTADGVGRWHLRWCKATNRFVVKKIYEGKTYLFRQDLMEATVHLLQTSKFHFDTLQILR